jgi:hypothetical protein
MIPFEKYGQHQPLNRQAERSARGVPVSLSTPADQVGAACTVLRPLYRSGKHPQQHLATWSGILQADAYGGYGKPYAARDTGPIVEASSWAQRVALFYGLIVTARLNGVDPQAWLADVLARIAEHPVNRLDELLLWN